ncbi:MAG: ABC transporter ATP-binding protein [Candidatus Promineifilaceae bacterium]
MTQVQLHHLSKHFGDFVAVSDLNLEVKSGEITAFLGPSGCGKTTTMKMIAGLLTPTQGDILFNSKSVKNVPAEHRKTAMVFQKPLLFPYMTIGDNVGFGLKMRHTNKNTIDQRVQEMLDLVQLPGYQDRRPSELSGGQEQRISLARALIIQPQVLLLDEPLSQLDANLRRDMRELIHDVQRQLNITSIFVTHDQEEAISLAQKVAVIFNGRLQQYDAPSAYYQRPANIDVARFFGWSNFVPGEKEGALVHTPLGDLTVQQDEVSSREVVLTIRPEAIRVGSTNENVVNGRVKSFVYLGTKTNYWVEVNGIELQVVTEEHKAHEIGSNIELSLDPAKIWLLTPENCA